MAVDVPYDVGELLDTLQAAIQATLADNLVGVYLRGSLALGDFIPATSDVDVLAVTERPVTPAEFARLAALHAQLAALPHPYAQRLEMAYLDRDALRRFVPGQQHPTLGQGEVLAWSEHRANWILERWTVRTHGVPVYGPEPRTIIDPITADDLRAAVCARLPDWAAWADEPDDPDWLLPRSHKAYVVETMCRTLYTVGSGEIVSKPRAVAWASATLPEPWRTLIIRSQGWRTDQTTDLSIVSDVMGFVKWAAGCERLTLSQWDDRAS